MWTKKSISNFQPEPHSIAFNIQMTILQFWTKTFLHWEMLFATRRTVTVIDYNASILHTFSWYRDKHIYPVSNLRRDQGIVYT